MIGLIQRVSKAHVTVGGEMVGSIAKGVLALIAVQPGDTLDVARQLIERIVAYRVFDDAAGKMNLSLADIGGELLLVSQFTLAADTRKGLRPGFSTAAPPTLGRELFERAVDYARAALPGRILVANTDDRRNRVIPTIVVSWRPLFTGPRRTPWVSAFVNSSSSS
jgi:D-tyrosyl-tRNA(Tyr) deacylase